MIGMDCAMRSEGSPRLNTGALGAGWKAQADHEHAVPSRRKKESVQGRRWPPAPETEEEEEPCMFAACLLACLLSSRPNQPTNQPTDQPATLPASQPDE